MDLKDDRFKDFLEKQNHTWKLSGDNYQGLNHVVEKTFLFDGFQVSVQFNPERMRSSAAKVDKSSIAARNCFLCSENRPVEQFSLNVGHDFLLLVNPFPIFKTHFTIPSLHHIPQYLVPNLRAIFDISRQMEGYLLFYNGPECGASAPDHLHFQAGERGLLPVESEFERLKLVANTLLFQSDHLRIWAFDNYLRKLISLETDSPESAIEAIENIVSRFGELQSDKAEPMINLLCTFGEGKWTIHLFPRRLHRPSQFYAQGEDRLLISPASVDFGGLFITPRKEDFEKITASDVKDIFNQVTLGEEAFGELKSSITNNKLRMI